MGKLKVVTQKVTGTTYEIDDSYKLELEALGTLDTEIIEVAASTEEEFISAARDADALIVKGRSITKNIIDSLEKCKVIALGSVGAILRRSLAKSRTKTLEQRLDAKLAKLPQNCAEVLRTR